MFTRKEYEAYLNNFDVPTHDRESMGGRIPDHCKWGSWLRRNDPVQFSVGFNEWCQIKLLEEKQGNY